MVRASAASRASAAARSLPIPALLARDLAAITSLTEFHESARSRLTRTLGPDFAERLLTGRLPAAQRRR